MKMLRPKVLEIASSADNVEVKENFSSFNISFESTDLIVLTEESILAFTELINPDDQFRFTIQVDNAEAIVLNNQNGAEEFISQLDEELKYYESGETVRIKLESLRLKVNI